MREWIAGLLVVAVLGLLSGLGLRTVYRAGVRDGAYQGAQLALEVGCH